MAALPVRANPHPLPPLRLPENLPIEYVNLVRIAHSASEMVFDFAQILPENPQAQILSRIVMSPLGAKLFLRALIDNMARYEAAFGEITIPGDPNLAEALFRPPAGGPPGNPPGTPPPDEQG